MSKDAGLEKQLGEIQRQLKQMRKEILEASVSINEGRISTADVITNILKGQITGSERQITESKRHIAELKASIAQLRLSNIRWEWSFFFLLFSIFLSALIGVVGNWFVSLWFQPHSEAIIIDLGISGGFLIAILAALTAMMIKVYRGIAQRQ